MSHPHHLDLKAFAEACQAAYRHPEDERHFMAPTSPLGFLVMMAGLGLFVYGGGVFVRDSLRPLISPRLKAKRERNQSAFTAAERRAVRRENLRYLRTTWGPDFAGLFWRSC